ncbi:MAG TPA: hypothetical protein VE986_06825 [Hyphomicrobiales bacterium]|nr:hypothetical protein [Hyphomicrobiales bacterium]
MVQVELLSERPRSVAAADSDALRVSGQMDMRKLTTSILLHMLSNEFRFPLLFLLRCKLTVGSFRKTIDPGFPKELIDLAALPLWVYINLKKKIGQKKAFEIMRVTILTGGIASWNFTYKAAEQERNFEAGPAIALPTALKNATSSGRYATRPEPDCIS